MNTEESLIKTWFPSTQDLQEYELTKGCEVCYKDCTVGNAIAVKDLEFKNYGKRVMPWYICKDCAEKISEALLAWRVNGGNFTIPIKEQPHE